MFALLLSLSLRAQSYSIESFQDVYEELESYHSILIEEKGHLYWDKRFELDFIFPFFEFEYDYLICDFSGVCDFDDTIGSYYPIYLMTFGYMFDNVLDTFDIESDVRYSLVTRSGLKSLVIQFTKVRLESDTSVEEFDSYINFQLCFYENGDLEVRFGDINLDNSPCYVPGDGFYAFFDNYPPVNLGPAMGLTNPQNDEIEIGLDGAYDDFDVVDFGYLRVLPPPGWVIRFKRNPDAVLDMNSSMAHLYPNPATTEITLDSEIDFEKVEILSTDGALIKTEDLRDRRKIYIDDLLEGMYLVRMYAGERVIVGKFVKM